MAAGEGLSRGRMVDDAHTWGGAARRRPVPRRDKMSKAMHIASLLAFGIVASAAAQHPVRAQAPRVKPSAPAAKPETRGTESAEQTKSFTGISKKLPNITPHALQNDYQTALAADPTPTRAQL